MPPKEKLPAAQIADFEEWVRRGAPDPRRSATGALPPVEFARARDHWAFRPPVEPALPEVRRQGAAADPIDLFILARLEAKGLDLSTPADRRTLLRRVSFDLTGLPPTAEGVEAFLADGSPDAFSKVVDRLLASPRYGERWGRHWLDLARYSDTKGYVYEGRDQTHFVHAHAYRDWVIRAFNEDLPYDEFLVRQIAGDRVASGGDRSALAAMGFLTVGRRFLYVVHDIIDDQIDVLTRSTMALTVSCARCHDHKFDPIPTQDYYSLYGVFHGSMEKTAPLVEVSGRAEDFQAFDQEFQKRRKKFQDVSKAKSDALLNRLRAKVADYLLAVLDADKAPTEEFYVDLGTDDVNPVIVHQWDSYLLHTAKKFHSVFAAWHALAALPPGDFALRAAEWLQGHRARLNPRVAEALGGEPPVSMREVAERYGRLFGEIFAEWQAAPPEAGSLPDPAAEEIRQILFGGASPVSLPPRGFNDIQFFFDEKSRVEMGKAQADLERWIVEAAGAPPHAVYLEDRAIQRDPRVFRRGNPANKGDEVPRRFLAILSGAERRPFVEGSGRTELARAIASPDNPLTARVLVNRVWAHHFGEGIVRTPSDFGFRSEPPTHPELLDWLALRFVEDGWSIKKLHRRILLSAAYQQASGDNPRAREVDPDNRLLWRMNRRRLDFEAMRDALLAVAGDLDFTMGGRPESLESLPFSRRRTVYGLVDRLRLPKMMRLFDFANPDAHSPQRHQTTVPPQALFLMNSPLVTEQAARLARRPDVAGADGVDRTIDALYRHVYARVPRQDERAIGRRAIEEPTLKPVAAPTSPWSYGFGEFDPAAGRLKGFQPLPYFAGGQWQAWRDRPDLALGRIALHAGGGHPGKDAAHAAVLRWTSPRDGMVTISGTVTCPSKDGDGVRARLVSSRSSELAAWTVRKVEAETKIRNLDVKKGETLDFVVDCRGDPTSDSFTWAPSIRMKDEEWSLTAQFAGPPPPAMGPLERYAQALLLANEFVFLD